ncbi:E3 ubiquitin-protein ligase TRIM7-like [Lacerta agilis]|uniref:E3 ubiquitin-protein ligase TRIM7-like n=1 Tax=Lacerta agilis TaxID=80427 RepID=UPI0014193A97|nr:E3 ubiquitin-protein ligase TRIM7-like [Lacerta agilis]
MAEERYRKRIRKEVTCSICLGYFTRPVELDCKHNFCEGCILRCWEESGEETRCPECRKSVEKDFKRNRLLTNMAEIVSEWDHSEEREAQRRRSECQRHQRALDLFCLYDEVLFCDECDESLRRSPHTGHSVVPVEEAAEDYRDQLFKCLKTLNEERAKIEANKASTSSKSEVLVQLKQMEEVETEIVRKTNEHLAKLSRELDSLQNTFREVVEKVKQPPSEFLQDIRSTLQRYQGRQTFEAPNIFPPEYLSKVWDFRDMNPFVEAAVEQFKGNGCKNVMLDFELVQMEVDEKLKVSFVMLGEPEKIELEGTLTSGLPLQKATVTLDPATAHPQLILSEDRRSARWGQAHQELPDNPNRFDTHTFVLGCEEFTAGRHCWEVTMETAGEWGVGVARKSVRRKGMFYYWFINNEGIWGLGQLDSEPRSACWSPPLPGPKLKRFRVTVNYAGRLIAFFDADTGDLLKSFTKAEFSGESLLPIFCVGPETYLELHPVTP